MDKAREVVERLTEAQREAVLELEADPIDRPISWSVRVGYGLERIGLARRTLLTDRTKLTPLGLEVRSLLIGDASHG